MAEGLARVLIERTEADVEVWSAGTEARGVHPMAVRVMTEIGVDISHQYSKTISDVPQDVDRVITLCDEAAASCPLFPAQVQRLHWSFRDPSAVPGNESDRLAAFRNVRDQISRRLDDFWRKEISR